MRFKFGFSKFEELFFAKEYKILIINTTTKVQLEVCKTEKKEVLKVHYSFIFLNKGRHEE